jgi:hypothetical protein
MKNVLFLLLANFLYFNAGAQNEIWAAKDKQKLIDNYQRCKKEVNDETTGLTKEQWNFRQAEGKWTIGQVLEHLNMWHLITQDQIRYAETQGARPDLVAKTLPDSAVTAFIYEEKNHSSPDLTIPTGLIPDDNNRKYFNIKIDEMLKKLEASMLDFNLYFRLYPDTIRNLYQIYIIHYGHIDRHLRQIRRIKSDSRFPK